MDVHTLIVINAVVLAILVIGGGVFGFLGARFEEGSTGENMIAAFGVAFLMGWITVSASAFCWFWFIVLHFVLKWW